MTTRASLNQQIKFVKSRIDLIDALRRVKALRVEHDEDIYGSILESLTRLRGLEK